MRMANNRGQDGDLQRDSEPRPISSTIGRPDHIDVPKSSVMKPQTKSKNWIQIGAIEAELGMARRDDLGVDGAAGPARRKTQMSPGISAHQQEHQRRRPEAGSGSSAARA